MFPATACIIGEPSKLSKLQILGLPWVLDVLTSLHSVLTPQHHTEHSRASAFSFPDRETD